MRKIRGAADNVTTDVVILGAAAIGVYFLVVKPILGTLGVDPADQATITEQIAVPPSQNPFNYQFQPFIDFYNENTPTVESGQGQSFLSDIVSYMDMSANTTTLTNPTIQQFFISLKQVPPATSPWGTLDAIALSQAAEQLNSALSVGWFTISSDQAGAQAALSGLTNQMQVAFIANYFWWNFNADLLTSLNGSVFKAGMTGANLAQLINLVNSLPVQPN